MPVAAANGIELEYESLGTGDPLVLIMGIGAQMVHWPDGFCAALVEREFRVVRFDNRDVGGSTRLDHARVPKFWPLLARFALGLRVEAPYRLEDMADDVVGLLDALEIERAHIVGASLGGMVAQTVAIRSPARVATLTSIMSTPGGLLYSLALPRALRMLFRSPPKTREQAMERSVEFFAAVGGPRFEPDVEGLRERARRAFDRGLNPAGFLRQLAASMASGSRLAALRELEVPTLVIHGTADSLILPFAGRATAKAVPRAKLVMIEGMGHDLPPGTWPLIVDAIAEHARAIR